MALVLVPAGKWAEQLTFDLRGVSRRISFAAAASEVESIDQLVR